jgi:SAM-dependent methyltransferase
MKNYFLHRVFNRLAAHFKPNANKFNNSYAVSPHLKFSDRRAVTNDYLKDYLANCSVKPSFLDVGGRRGELQRIAKGFDYSILELEENSEIEDEVQFLVGDICKCPQIADNSYDITYSNNVIEHLKEPWKAVEEIVRITKVGGLFIHIAPFAWRYHPCPIDYFRFTTQGLSHLFEITNNAVELHASYDIVNRRNDHRGGKMIDNLDTPPVDHLGGWRENWMTIYVGKKTK